VPAPGKEGWSQREAGYKEEEGKPGQQERRSGEDGGNGPCKTEQHKGQAGQKSDECLGAFHFLCR